MQGDKDIELSPKYSVEGYIADADRALASDEIDRAIEGYKKALTYTNYRKDEEQAALVLASLGDCYYLQREYREARRYYQKAFELPDGVSNAYVLLRMGEVFFDEGDKERAKYYLMQAYLIEGAELFEDEDRKYFDLIEDEELVLLEDEPGKEPEEEQQADDGKSDKRGRFSLKRIFDGWVDGGKRRDSDR